jgi:GH25 family lysozyme M1 (1,4-beta-N-acetylmuramidase)
MVLPFITDTYPETYSIPIDATASRPRGRDLSKYDGDITNWDAHDFYIIRCYDGNYQDPKFTAFRDAAKAHNKAWWPYVFYDFLYPAIPQATAAWNIIKNDPGQSSLCFDVEEWYVYKFPPRANLLTGMQQLRDTYFAWSGKNPKFYMNPACIHYLKPLPTWLLACELWVANWGVAAPDFEPWAKWTLWQYQGDPDLNYFNGTYADFNDWLWQPPGPTVEQRLTSLEQRVTILEAECPKG